MALAHGERNKHHAVLMGDDNKCRLEQVCHLTKPREEPWDENPSTLKERITRAMEEFHKRHARRAGRAKQIKEDLNTPPPKVTACGIVLI